MSSLTVVALIPHYGRDEASNRWLRQCIESLQAQTVALDGILVVDDLSPCSPDTTIRDLSAVSLYRNESNTGPYAINDLVFAKAGADALLLQDSDDWSSSDRLERLLDGMRQWQADVVGCQIRTVSENGSPISSAFDQLPFEPRAALLDMPTAYPLILPSTLISCAFVRRIGGFSTGLKFGADSEFIRRACFGGEVRNIDSVCYFRRIHPGSLTQAPSTGFSSPARAAVQKVMQDHARSLVASFCAGETVDLRPKFVSPPTRLQHVLGPAVPGL